MNNDYFLEFELDYDRESIFEVFHEYIHEFPSERNLKSPFKAISENIDFTSHEVISKLYDRVPAIPKRPNYFSLFELTRPVKHHCNPRNNGTVFFPISGSLDIKFFSYPTRLDAGGRPTFSPMAEERPILSAEEESNLIASNFVTIGLVKPIAINGLKLHSYEPTSLEPPVVLVLKIPLEVSWLDIINSIQQ